MRGRSTWLGTGLGLDLFESVLASSCSSRAPSRLGTGAWVGDSPYPCTSPFAELSDAGADLVTVSRAISDARPSITLDLYGRFETVGAGPHSWRRSTASSLRCSGPSTAESDPSIIDASAPVA